MRAVVHGERVVTSRSNIKGFKDDFADVTEDVVLLEGEVHGLRPPGSLRFTSDTSPLALVCCREALTGYRRKTWYSLR